MFFQDYPDKETSDPLWGMKKAVDDFFDKQGLSIHKKPIPHFKNSDNFK